MARIVAQGHADKTASRIVEPKAKFVADGPSGKGAAQQNFVS
ncbi:hypothetical protein ACS0ZG_35110 [Burkholderia gladioli]|nr:hypothetical protein [Burkholderia gladioli]MDA0573039.1 hypothetical protein [Burkholderia gladioli]MDA0600592.1 hypothetical protein [Burkholderia gladioli]MDJ1160523.1 hypothetical protein [Burkholderia gladioli pv. gladioli]MDN7811973.1 hypothetical protein [Burkholderia gladioli]